MKLIESIFNDSTGISFCTVKHKNNFYTGISKLHPEDEDAIIERIIVLIENGQL